jgi:peptide/nickel transport system permease protein
MAAYIVHRLLQAVLLLFIVSVITFFLIHAAPGGPALLSNPDLNRDQIARIRAHLGLDDPVPIQYLRWLRNVARGNFGRSFNTVEPVLGLIANRLPNTLLLAGSALAVAIAVAIPLGVLSATGRNSLVDRLVAGSTFLGISTPVFWLGIVLIVVFAVELRVLPAGGMYKVGAPYSIVDRIRHLILPLIVLATANLAEFTRYTRSAMIGVLGEDYIRTARAKGVARPTIVFHHALRNALVPVITVIGVHLPRAVSGAAITETVFSWPGMGQLAVESAATRDYPVVLGATLVVAGVVVVTSLLTDLAYGYLDPRIRLG